MRQFKTFLITAILTIGAFSAIVFTSCHKDKCAGVVCSNGGSCSNGLCSCPSGYSGTHCQYSSIYYRNNTYTPVSITVNGTSATIPVGQTVAFSASSGTSADVSASTSGTYGLVITWNFSDIFPSNGDQLTEPMDISANYFFLELTNTGFNYAIGLHVNYMSPTYQSDENISIPGDGNTYGMGYYDAFNSTKIKVDFGGSEPSLVASGIPIPNTLDAYYNLQVN